jgi:hypothetical protein
MTGKKCSFKKCLIFLLVIITVILIMICLRIPNRAKVIYSILFLILFWYIFLKDSIVSCTKDSLMKYINNKREDLYQNYLNNSDKDLPAKNLNSIKIYYINLDKSVDRKNELEKDLKKYGLEAIKISGVDGKKIKNFQRDCVDGMKFISYDENLTPSELGCILSHFKAIKQAYDDGQNIAIILEDDIGLDLIPHWETPLNEFIQKLPDNWTIINLKPSCYNLKTLVSYKIKHCWTTGAYLINREGMKKILNLRDADTWIIKKYGKCKKGSADCLLYHALNGTYSAPDLLFFSRPENSTMGHSVLTAYLKSAIDLHNF